MSLSVISSFLLTVLGIVYAVATFMLPEAALGRPHEPKIFPAMLAIFLIVCGTILLVKEFKAQQLEKKQYGGINKISAKYVLQMLLTVVNGIAYTLMFDQIGYVFSTIIFLILQFLIFGGVKNLKYGIIVSVVFALAIYFIFNNLLGIILPNSALGFI